MILLLLLLLCRSLLLLLLLFLLRWQYSPMRIVASLMDFSQSAQFLDVSFQLLILHLLKPVCTQLHHLFLVVLLVDFPKHYC